MKKMILPFVMGVASLLLPLTSRADISSGLVLHLPLNEASGTTAVDASGSGYNATFVNAPGDDSQWTNGWVGGESPSIPRARIWRCD